MEEQGMMKRKSRGRQKIEIKKIEKASRRQVTFSKRRVGLFKKASEIALLTGAQIGILVRSPGNKIFAYGSPNLDTVVDRWLLYGNNNDINVVSPSPSSTITSESKEGFWWEEPVADETMELEELERYVAALEDLKNNVSKKIEQLLMPMSEFDDEDMTFVDECLNLINEDECGFLF